MRPTFVIEADAKDVTAAVAARLSTLTLADCIGGEADTLTLELDNADERLEPPATGRILTVRLGYDGQVVDMGRFVVDEVSAQGWPSSVTVTARGTPFDAQSQYGALQTKKRRSFELTTVGELVSTIAGDSGLAPAVAASMASIDLGHVDQVDESDIHLLSRIAADLGAYVKPAFGRMMFLPAGQGTTASGASIEAVTIARSACQSYRLNSCKRVLAASVVAYYRDHTQGLDVEVTSGTGEPVERLKFPHQSAAAAKAAADGRLAEAGRLSGTLTLVLAGDPTLQAGLPVVTSGFPLGIDGRWTVRKATHELADGGYTTTLELDTLATSGGGPAGGGTGGGTIDLGGLDPTPPLTPSVP